MIDKPVCEPAAFGLLIRDVSRLVRRRFDRKAGKSGLTQAQWAVICHLVQSEGIRQREMAEQLDVEPITLVGILDKLEMMGVVERRPDPSDRRARLLYLTEGARPLMREIDRIRNELRQEAFAGISEPHQELIMKALQQVKKNLSSARDNTH